MYASTNINTGGVVRARQQDSDLLYLRIPHLRSCPKNLHPCLSFVAAESRQLSAHVQFAKGLATSILLISAG